MGNVDDVLSEVSGTMSGEESGRSGDEHGGSCRSGHDRPEGVRLQETGLRKTVPVGGGDGDEREATFNSRARGPAHEIAVPVEHVTAIHGFMIDIDCKLLNLLVVGESALASPQELYDQHVRHWLDREPVLAKAEVRDTGGGLHVLLWLDTPILCKDDEAREWDVIARGLRNVLPGDPSLNGIIAMTRPVGAMNTKHDPPRCVRQLREGQPVNVEEVLALNLRLTEEPARLWMKIFFGRERVAPCPFCGSGALGIAGGWQVQCYECGRLNAEELVYRFFAGEFLSKRRGGQ